MIYSVIRKFTMQQLAPHTQTLIRTLKIQTQNHLWSNITDLSRNQIQNEHL